MFRKAIRHYVINRVSKISLDAVQDGRYMWLGYGFKPESTAVQTLHRAIKMAYRKESQGKDIPASIRLPTSGIGILDFRYRGIPAGKRAVNQLNEITLTLDLESTLVRLGLIGRGWLEPWLLWN